MRPLVSGIVDWLFRYDGFMLSSVINEDPTGLELIVGGQGTNTVPCPNCGRPPMRHAWLSPELMRLGMNFGEPIPLYFCWTCEGGYRTQFYRRIAENHWELDSLNGGEVFTDFPYDNFPILFPEKSISLFWEDLPELDEDELCDGFFAHRVGGYAYPIQELPAWTDEFYFLATLSAMPELGTPFADNPYVLMHYWISRDFSQIRVYQECD